MPFGCFVDIRTQPPFPCIDLSAQDACILRTRFSKQKLLKQHVENIELTYYNNNCHYTIYTVTLLDYPLVCL